MKIKNTKLMIGDKVKSQTGIVHTIVGISHDNPHEYFPIPLTPEILEKNEWKSDNNISECLGIEVFASEKNKCCVEFDGEDEYSFNTYERWEDTDYYGAPMDWGYRYITSIYHLRYVHELQQALRLCGLNELATNFKV